MSLGLGRNSELRTKHGGYEFVESQQNTAWVAIRDS